MHVSIKDIPDVSNVTSPQVVCKFYLFAFQYCIIDDLRACDIRTFVCFLNTQMDLIWTSTVNNYEQL